MQRRPLSFTQEYPDGDIVTKDLARAHAMSAGKWKKDLLDRLDSNDFAGLCDYSIRPQFGDDVNALIHARQCLAFFSKNADLDIGVDKEFVAWEKFCRSELLCAKTNNRLTFLRGINFKTVDPRLAGILHSASRKIEKVLGKVPSLAQLQYKFGPGANTTVNARASSPRHKLGARLACSSELIPIVSALLAEMPAWCQIHMQSETSAVFNLEVEVHHGNLQFVPKNAKTYRSIVIEPILNSVVQKAVGTFLKRRLRRAGVDLSKQSINQRLACLGSVGGLLATLDLSSASDTIARAIVELLLPEPWYDFLSGLRTGTVTYKGDSIRLEKFSSMGNGFTFELETLIFWALSAATIESHGIEVQQNENLAVYGDDMIVPVEVVSILTEVLTFCGFELNAQKSFSEGPFRESCGTDWLQGIDVRPFYLREKLKVFDLFKLHNFYMRTLDFGSAARVSELIPEDLKLYGPDGYGDGHLIGDWDPKKNPKHVKRGWEGGTFETFTTKNRKSFRKTRGDYVLPCYSIYVTDVESHLTKGERASNHMVVRGEEGYKRIMIYTLRQMIFGEF